MTFPIQITFREMGPSPAIEAAIRERAERLDRFHPHITSCRVVVEAPHHHQHKGGLYGVRVEVMVPGGEIAVTHEGRQNHAHEDVYVAVRDAFEAVGRLLEDRARKQRGDVKSHGIPLHGRIVRLFPEKGYGFIETTEGEEIYFHRNAVTHPGFDKLEAGSEVRLVVAENEGDEGPQASTVTAMGKHHIIG
jgi:cold shock CspA family protein/ribosome-associated translation inhibitor RaiA